MTADIVKKYFPNLTEKQLEQFELLFPLYAEWNEKINVVSRKDIEAIYERHVLHSLSIAARYPFASGLEIIDIGTGGGFPGIPLAIFFPEVQFHLVDSIGKKLKVVEAVSAALEISNVTIQHSRAEDIKGRKFDFAVSRAVAPLGELWKWSRPLLRKERKMEDLKNGLICLKGGDLTEEIAASTTRPHQQPIGDLFDEPFFEEKFILYVPL